MSYLVKLKQIENGLLNQSKLNRLYNGDYSGKTIAVGDIIAGNVAVYYYNSDDTVVYDSSSLYYDTDSISIDDIRSITFLSSASLYELSSSKSSIDIKLYISGNIYNSNNTIYNRVYYNIASFTINSSDTTEYKNVYLSSIDIDWDNYTTTIVFSNGNSVVVKFDKQEIDTSNTKISGISIDYSNQLRCIISGEYYVYVYNTSSTVRITNDRISANTLEGNINIKYITQDEDDIVVLNGGTSIK
jgi:hypothetical protein